MAALVIPAAARAVVIPAAAPGAAVVAVQEFAATEILAVRTLLALVALEAAGMGADFQGPLPANPAREAAGADHVSTDVSARA